jgi:ABC-type nitrate/sulfonate/bicarbonate transport system substrate-binding protein
MKISTAVTLGIVSIIAIAVIATIGGSLDQSSQSKIRVAFFPSIGHAVPIVGIENGIFEKGIGEQIQIETKLFDSGPQVIESIFASSIDVAYVGPGPVINGFLKSGQPVAVQVLLYNRILAWIQLKTLMENVLLHHKLVIVRTCLLDIILHQMI